MTSLLTAMRQCGQTTDTNVLQHGVNVYKYFLDLKSHVLQGSELKYKWKAPEWIYSKELWDAIDDIGNNVIRSYIVFHDCGKPFCLTIDEDGRRHFPNHAEMSSKVWSDIHGEGAVSDLMGMDMLIHTIKDADIDEFKKNPYWPILVIVGLCEIHSNASMFGGIESSSFKSKYKQIDRRAKALLRTTQAA